MTTTNITKIKEANKVALCVSKRRVADGDHVKGIEEFFIVKKGVIINIEAIITKDQQTRTITKPSKTNKKTTSQTSHQHVRLKNHKTYLKKSFLQYSLESLLKHFSVSGWVHSQQRTHEACHALSRTFSKNLSKIGLLHPAHGSPRPTAGSPLPKKE